ncbi:MAG: RDD family protein [Polyangiaceae bacterium]|nr:RDD family protein [Polyangiaceae bacterium]
MSEPLPSPPSVEPAGPGARLAGAAVDLGLFMALRASGEALAFLAGGGEAARFLLGFGAPLPLLFVNWVLTAHSGRTLGKLVAKTRIVRTDGRRAGFVYGVVLRAWVTGWVWSLVWLTLPADVLFVFRCDRRCLHDRLADTCVVRA